MDIFQNRNALCKQTNDCVPPAYVSCQICGAIAFGRVGKCHCLVQRLEQDCHTLCRSQSVCLMLTGPVHHCWEHWFSLEHSHRKRSNFSLSPLACRLSPHTFIVNYPLASLLLSVTVFVASVVFVPCCHFYASFCSRFTLFLF